MATNAQIGSQTKLSYWNEAVSPMAYTPIGEVRSITGLGTTRPEIEVTHLDSTAVERIKGLPDGKQIAIRCNTVAASLAAFETLDALPLITFKLDFPSPLSETRYFQAIPLGFEHGDIQSNGELNITQNARISGPITETDPLDVSPMV